MNDVCDKFKEICHILNVGSIELSNAKIVNKKLFRANGLNDKRANLLIVTGKLKTTRVFENLYIQREISFWQRQELSERRHRARMSTVDSGESSRSDGIAVAGSDGRVGRGRGRGFGRGQVSSKAGSTVYGSTPHVARK